MVVLAAESIRIVMNTTTLVNAMRDGVMMTAKCLQENVSVHVQRVMDQTPMSATLASKMLFQMHIPTVYVRPIGKEMTAVYG